MEEQHWTTKQTEEHHLVEFTDEEDRPLVVGARKDGTRIGLWCRVIGVVLRESSKQKRLYVRKRPAYMDFAGCWDLAATGSVRAGEAREDAARRALAETIGLTSVTVKELTTFRNTGSGERLFVTLFEASVPPGFPFFPPDGVSEGMFLDRDEIQGLVSQVPELLTPALLWTIRAGWLESKTTKHNPLD